MRWHVQAYRYAIVGLVSNLAGYAAYLGITAIGMHEKVAMTLLYVVGVLQTFVFNRSWSFQSHSSVHTTFVRYAWLYALGYVLNVIAMHALVDRAGYPHQAVMAGLIGFMAVFFFVGQRYWVFRASRAVDAGV